METRPKPKMSEMPFLALSSIVQKNNARSQYWREINSLCVKLASCTLNIREIVKFQYSYLYQVR